MLKHNKSSCAQTPERIKNLGSILIEVAPSHIIACKLPRTFADIKANVSPFVFLSLDLPPPPLFQDSVEKNIIPQVSIHSVLAKYDGKTTQVGYSYIPCHPIFILAGVSWATEALQVSITSPIHHLTFQAIYKQRIRGGKEPHHCDFPPSRTGFRRLYVFCSTRVLLLISLFAADLDAPPSHPPTTYDLIANLTHESVAGTTRDKENTVWKVHLRAAGGGGEGEKWFQIQDLIVEETRKEMIFLGETVLQVCLNCQATSPL